LKVVKNCSFQFDLTIWNQSSGTCCQATQRQRLWRETLWHCTEDCASKTNVVSINKS